MTFGNSLIFGLGLVALLGSETKSVNAFQPAVSEKIQQTKPFFSLITNEAELENSSSSRRDFVSSILAGSAAVASAPLILGTNEALAADEDTVASSPSSSTRVLVLGGTGLVGSEVVRQLARKGVEVISTSRNGRDGTVALDFSTMSDDEISSTIGKLSNGCSAVISTVGAIGADAVVQTVNAGTGKAAKSVAGSVKEFVYISVAPEVRDFAKDIDFFKNYMAGKLSSENAIKEAFSQTGKGYTLIEPTFIYGGNEFKLNPPRVASGYGALVESVLSLGPFRAMADVFPGFLGVALEPPISAEVRIV